MKNSVWAVLAAFLWMASPAGGDPGDERILLARDAARSGDRARLASLVPPTGHPLDPYPEYWALSAQLARPGDINPLPILGFLERERGSWLAERLRGDSEDLLHKATGWMLREAGKRDVAALRTFLARQAAHLPRTALRYAIERLPPAERRKWLRHSI